MGDWEANWDRAVLGRIVALLFALANLADLAAGLPFLRRRQVLGVLGHGEAKARAFVIDMVSGAPAPADAPGEIVDAASLAARLRVLALVLYAMLTRRGGRCGAAGARACRPPRRISGLAVRWPASPPAPDTS